MSGGDDVAPRGLPESGTVPLGNFIRAHLAEMKVLGFVGRLVLRSDEVRRVALEALAEGERDPEKQAEYQEGLANERLIQGEYLQHRQIILEMTLVRAVDNFLTYLSEVLAAVFRIRPEMLRSGKQVRVDFVLEHTSMSELVDALAERTVDEASYLSLGDLADYFEGHGLRLFPDSAALAQAVRIVESRNLVVHNRGVINERFVARVGEGSVGHRLSLSTDSVFDDVDFLAASAQRIDAQAVGKYGLVQEPIEPE
jgi:hypothetical protein